MNPNLSPTSPLLTRGLVTLALLCAGHASADTLSPARNHANGEHPAVLVARQAAGRGIDSNTFLVQPPASVTWTLGPAAQTGLRVATDATAAGPQRRAGARSAL